MRILISFAALFLSVILLQLSSGSVGPLDVLSGQVIGFSTAEIGFLGSAHFAGFFIGCWIAPKMMGNVGYSRSFAVFTATGAIGLLSHMLIINPIAWAVMRLAAGFCVAGAYTVIEAWLQSKVTNETRGRTMGVYRIVDMGASLVAQLMISVLSPAHYVSYNLLALLCCATLIPLALTTSVQPDMPEAPRLRPMLAVEKSPLAAAAVVVSALSSASFRMVGPIYGTEIGLTKNGIAIFLASFVVGGAISQFPVGWLADKFDRRWVLIWLSVAAIISCMATALTQGIGDTGVMLMAAFFGLTSFPIYSVAAAHAHDFADDLERVELSAALLFFYAIGAIAAPWGASALIEVFGPAALFYLIAAGHVVLVIFGVIRMRARPTQGNRTRYVYAPRTSFLIGRLISWKRKPD